jgi:hypothetical protein
MQHISYGLACSSQLPNGGPFLAFAKNDDDVADVDVVVVPTRSRYTPCGVGCCCTALTSRACPCMSYGAQKNQ